MNRTQKLVVKLWLAVCAGFILYPPFSAVDYGGAISELGHAFVFYKPSLHALGSAVVRTEWPFVWQAIIVTTFVAAGLWIYGRYQSD